MPTVRELTEVYGNFMLAPRSGPGVCRTCFNFTDGYERCYGCTLSQPWLDAVAPISYSVGQEQLHHVLAAYKRRNGDAGRRLGTELAAVLWRHLDRHETCVAATVERRFFDLVTTVPSGDAGRDEHHPLRWIVGELVGATRDRYERLLRRSGATVKTREFSSHKYACLRSLHGESILLIDDTWTTGASAQSAASALKAAGAGPTAAVVLGRHLNRSWHENDRRLRGITRPFDWNRCPFCPQ